MLATIASLGVWAWLRSQSEGSDLLDAETTAWRIAALRGVGMPVGFTAILLLEGTALDDRTPYIDPGMVVVGALLAALAIAIDLPMVLLVVLSALGGASAITTGVMLLAGTIDTREFDDGDVTTRAADGWWWYVVYVGLAVAGIVLQVRGADRLRRSVRASWAERA